jgi:hypothetical protein
MLTAGILMGLVAVAASTAHAQFGVPWHPYDRGHQQRRR